MKTITKEGNKVIVTKFIPFIKVEKKDEEWTAPNGLSGYFLSDGWDGSYHDAHYYPQIVAWGKGKRCFRLAMRALRVGMAKVKELKENQPKRDSSTERMKLRYAVRSGD